MSLGKKKNRQGMCAQIGCNSRQLRNAHTKPDGETVMICDKCYRKVWKRDRSRETYGGKQYKNTERGRTKNLERLEEMRSVPEREMGGPKWCGAVAMSAVGVKVRPSDDRPISIGKVLGILKSQKIKWAHTSLESANGRRVTLRQWQESIKGDVADYIIRTDKHLIAANAKEVLDSGYQFCRIPGLAGKHTSIGITNQIRIGYSEPYKKQVKRGERPLPVGNDFRMSGGIIYVFDETKLNRKRRKPTKVREYTSMGGTFSSVGESSTDYLDLSVQMEELEDFGISDVNVSFERNGRYAPLIPHIHQRRIGDIKKIGRRFVFIPRKEIKKQFGLIQVKGAKVEEIMREVMTSLWLKIPS